MANTAKISDEKYFKSLKQNIAQSEGRIEQLKANASTVLYKDVHPWLVRHASGNPEVAKLLEKVDGISNEVRQEIEFCEGLKSRYEALAPAMENGSEPKKKPGRKPKSAETAGNTPNQPQQAAAA